VPVLQSTVEDRMFDGDGVMRSVTITNPAGTVKTWSMTWDPTRPNGEVLSWQSSGQRTSFLYGNERAASMNATGLQSYEYNPLGDIIAGRAGTVESTGYAPYGKGDTLNATVEPRFGYRGEIQIGNRVHLRARDLNTTTARFDRKDPLAGIPGETVETNQYHYANNDPIGRTDPSGLQPTDQTFAPPLPKCTNGICVAGLQISAQDGPPFNNGAAPSPLWKPMWDPQVGPPAPPVALPDPCLGKIAPPGYYLDVSEVDGFCKQVRIGYVNGLVNGVQKEIPAQYCDANKCTVPISVAIDAYRPAAMRLASSITSNELVRCFSQLACGLATGSTLVLGGAFTGLVCVVTVGVGCVLAGALAGAAGGAVSHAALFRTSDGLVCASVLGAVGGAAATKTKALVAGFTDKPPLGGIVTFGISQTSGNASKKATSAGTTC
jgi:RHS repeat-associated protein